MDHHYVHVVNTTLFIMGDCFAIFIWSWNSLKLNKNIPHLIININKIALFI